jgi:hypothetical protein
MTGNKILDAIPAPWVDDLARQILDVALSLSGADDATKGRTLEALRFSAFRALIGRGDVADLDAFEAADALANRLAARIRDFESRGGRA